MLGGLGRLIQRQRWTSLVLILLISFFAAAWGAGVLAKFKQGGFEDPKASSTLVAKLGQSYFGQTNPDILVLYKSDRMTVDDPRFEAAVVGTVARLPKANVSQFLTYYTFEGSKGSDSFVSRDRHQTIVSIKVAGKDDATRNTNYLAVKDHLKAPGLDTRLGGAFPLGTEFGERVVADIVHAETITAIPLFVLLVLLFGAVTASLLPLVVALFSIIGGLAVLHLVTYVADVTSMALEVVTMMGVGLAIDYSLFVISRFREEMERGQLAAGLPPGKPWKQGATRAARRATKRGYRSLPRSGRRDVRKEYKRALKPVVRAALGRTLGTAGRTIMVSGITVSAALAGLLLFPQMFLRTIGLAGIATVMVAVFGATVLLPTMLALLGPKVEFGRMPWRRPKPDRDPDAGFWFGLGTNVMRHPLPYFAGVLVVLGVMFGPFLNVQFGSLDARALPKDSPSRAVVQTVQKEFPSQSAEPIDVVLTGDLVPRHWAPSRKGDNIPPFLEDFRKKLMAMPGVTGAQFTGYAGDYPGVRISVTHKYQPMDEHAQNLVKTIRGMSLAKDGVPMHIYVGGNTAAQMDLMSSLMRTLPKMALFVAVGTFLLLFMFFGSIVLPLKAIVMNVLSIGASFGAIVWGFQYGHLAGFLDFTPTGSVEATSMILILAVVFGLSMDYEVFLLSRIREEWDRSQDNRLAVARGMQKTGSIITSAALLFLVVIAGFATAGITVVKLIGVGMFVAITVDAVLVRSLLVPATMRFMGRGNWWLPGFLAGLHAALDLRERDDLPDTPGPVQPSTSPIAVNWQATPHQPPSAPAAPPVRPVPPAPSRPSVPPAANGAYPQTSPSATNPASNPTPPVPDGPVPDPTHGPWRPWEGGRPEPESTPSSGPKRGIVPNHDGSGWRWSSVKESDDS
ncbi:MMPL family transporter [Actinomadura rupiterrae]|uniref:MMPL family transporter n=1 Tax=Actinomadura rupiterrae TaxID=559627 RepID=UPI0026466325|nr:MMPL family transporter [Actinomadura rupiterrae]MCP2340300.1 RND superfamily putative drug exporter [Actinomadura rupiterrae]